MADAFSKSVVIQILISIPVIILGMVVMYLIHRAHSEPPQIVSDDLNDKSEIVESSLNEDGKPHKTEETDRPKPTQIKPKVKNTAKYDADLAKRFGKLKYNGYMQVGDAKYAWISYEKERIAVREGASLDDNIKIDEIHENFLLIAAVDSDTTQKIPFTSEPDEQPSTPSPPSSRYTPPPIPPVIEKSERKNARDRNSAGTVIRIEPELKTVKSVDETFTVQVKIDNGSDVFAVPFGIKYNPDALEAMGLHEGSYLKKDGGQTTFLTSTDKDKGKISVGLTRLGRIGGVSGSGTLMSVTFKTLKRGTAFLSFVDGKPVDSKLNVLPAKFSRGKIETK
jgi:hypothetical protein